MRVATTGRLIDRATRAVQWRFASSVFGAMSRFAVGVLLARLLTPADFGLMTLASVVIGFTRLVGDFGIGSAVVQRAGLSDRHVRTAFTFSVVFGVVQTVAIIVVAPLGALVVRDPRVTPILRVLAVGYAIGGVSVTAGALLRRHLDFKRRFFIDSASFVLGYGGVAAALALIGYGVWSLVWGSLVEAFVSSIAQLAIVQHSIRPSLRRREIQELLNFGLGSTLITCTNYLARNADNFVVGRWLGAAALGFYNRAYNLMSLPHTYAASVMSSVLFPVFAQEQGNQARVRRAYLLLTQLTAMVAGPAMGTMAIVAPYLVLSMYGPRWRGAVVPLQTLCLVGYLRALYHLSGILAQSVGRVYGELRNQLVYACLVIGGALIGLRYGLLGVAVGVDLAICYMFIASAQLALSATGTSFRAYVRVQVGAFVTTVATCFVALSTRFLLEAGRASNAVILIGVLIAAAAPWCVGVLWTVRRPDFEPLRAGLPRPIARLLGTLEAPAQREPGRVK
jgi:O-antigen/teichoic acid export membrane protein